MKKSDIHACLENKPSIVARLAILLFIILYPAMVVIVLWQENYEEVIDGFGEAMKMLFGPITD